MALNRKVLRKMLDGIPNVDIACDGVEAVQFVRKKIESALRITLPPLDIDALAKDASFHSHVLPQEPPFEHAAGATGVQQPTQQHGTPLGTPSDTPVAATSPTTLQYPLLSPDPSPLVSDGSS